MYTLVYLNGNLNRPDTLPSFLQANVGKSPLLQIDCVTPFQGTAEKLVECVCEHLNNIDPDIRVNYVETMNASIDVIDNKNTVSFMVVQIVITC